MKYSTTDTEIHNGTTMNRVKSVPIIIFWLAAASLTLISLADRSLWGSESRWAEIARRMILTGDYFHPQINGQPYFDKPLLSYWLIVGAAKVFGRMDEWALRLPSALAGLVALGATLNLGRRLWSEEVGRTAGWILLSTYGFLFWARTGEADMENLASIILAVAWYWSRRDRASFVSYFGLYGICFLGCQTKGLAAIAVPLIVLFPDLLGGGRWRRHLRVSHGLALAAGLALYFLPFFVSEWTKDTYEGSGLVAVFKENILRYFRPFDHKDPVTVYFYRLPVFLMPWVILFFGGLGCVLQSWKKRDWPDRWLVLALALTFLFFAASGSRRSYYIIPVLPFAALLSSLYLRIEDNEPWLRRVLAVQKAMILIPLVMVILSPLIGIVLKRDERIGALLPLLSAAGVLGVLSLGTGTLFWRRPELVARLTGMGSRIGPSILCGAVFMGGIFLWLLPIQERFLTLKPFCRELKSQIDEKQIHDVAFYRHTNPKVMFYLDLPEPITECMSPESFRAFMALPGEHKVVIAPHEYHQEMKDLFGDILPAEPTLREGLIELDPTELPDGQEAWILRIQRGTGGT